MLGLSELGLFIIIFCLLVLVLAAPLTSVGAVMTKQEYFAKMRKRGHKDKAIERFWEMKTGLAALDDDDDDDTTDDQVELVQDALQLGGELHRLKVQFQNDPRKLAEKMNAYIKGRNDDDDADPNPDLTTSVLTALNRGLI